MGKIIELFKATKEFSEAISFFDMEWMNYKDLQKKPKYWTKLESAFYDLKKAKEKMSLINEKENKKEQQK
jgi:hypothetical protein